jgi:ribose transport system permease protein
MIDLRRRILTSAGLPGYSLLLIAIILNILIQGLSFFSLWSFGSIMSNTTPLIMVAIAQTIIILSGGVDLSCGATMAFVNVTAIALTNSYGWPIPAAWAVALAAGIGVGLMNGLVIAFIRLPPFLVTFASMSIVSGLALLVWPIPGGTVPRTVYGPYNGFFLILPTTVWLVSLAVLIWYFISRFPIGTHIRAVGGGERSAYASGIRTERVKLFAYVIGGFYTGVAGLCLTALTASGDPLIGLPFTLKCLAAVILGGTLFDVGWGSIGGSIAGSLFLSLVANIVFFAFNNLVNLFPGFQISTYYQELVSNVIIILGLSSAVITQKLGTSARLKKSPEAR